MIRRPAKRTISKRRIARVLGRIDGSEQRKLDDALAIQLGPSGAVRP